MIVVVVVAGRRHRLLRSLAVEDAADAVAESESDSEVAAMGLGALGPAP